MVKTYTNEEVIQKLREAAGWKGAGKLAKSLGISSSYLSQIMTGQRPPTDAVLSAVGLRMAIIKRPVNNSCNGGEGSA